MQFESFGQKGKPLLVCVPGLMGGPEDFRGMLPIWEPHLHVIILDPNAEHRMSTITTSVMREISYDSTSKDILKIIDEQGAQKAVVTGISLGGKIVYDFAAKFPERLQGALITDVGPGAFNDSTLYNFVIDIVYNTDMNMEWPALKEHLKVAIPDRSMRSLLQSQITYPDRIPPAIWKTGMQNFDNMLRRQEIADQFDALEKVDAQLADAGSVIKLMRAGSISGVGESSLPRIRALRSVQIVDLKDATHFLHVTHKDLVAHEALALFKPDGT